MERAVYPGSFDPVTNGHLDIVSRAADIFDELVVAVANNLNKTQCFDIDERKYFLEEVTKNMKNVKVESFDGLLVDYVASQNVKVVIRGLRAVTDFEMEFQTALINKRLHQGVETVFLVTSTEYSFLSSSIIKEAASYGGDVQALVPPLVWEGLKKKFEIPGG
ncbi:pantetheine-phosphate adenylyltransferase [bacterium]